MIIPDVNLLFYASITGFPQHERARRWWEGALNGSVPVGLTSPAIFGFLRVATHGRILASPMPVSDAVGRVREWLSGSVATFVTPGQQHLDICFGLLEAVGTGANLTTDIQLAAHAIELDADLCSNDSDFGRFPGLRWIDPLRDRGRA